MAALTWGSDKGPYLNPANCWNDSKPKQSESNQQERIKLLIKTENYKFWLGGFVEGEGSLVVSITENPKVMHGIVLQPEFNVTQHESGINVLNSYKLLFNGLGNVHKKSGSDKVWVYSLKGTKNIKEQVIPFYKNYIVEYSSKYKVNVFSKFCTIIDILYENKGRTMEKLRLIELIHLIYLMNPESKGKSRKRTTEEVIGIINSYSRDNDH